MSNVDVPGMMLQRDYPANAPGDPRVKTPPDRARISLQQRMGDAFSILGSELKKPQPDPLALVKAQGMLRQIEAERMMPQVQPTPQPGLSPSTGITRPADRPIDSLTGQPLNTGTPYTPR